MQRGPKVPFNAMCVLRRIPLFFAASLFLFAGCAPKVSTPLPGGEFVRAAQQRMAEPEVSESLSGAPQPAYINVTALATRLPSWKLAEQIEKSGESVRFSSIAAPQAPRALSLQSAPLEKSGDSLPRPAGETDEPVTAIAGYERAPQRVAARDATPLEKQAKERQEGILESFLADVSRKQSANRSDEKMSLRAELEDAIEASQRIALANLEPLLPPPTTQLEMTNLRIQLLPNAPTTDEERKLAAARLAQLEATWRADLREQADKRFEELRRLLTEVPIEKREAGLKEIEKALQERATQDETLRQLVENTLRERVSAGFGADDISPFFIQLPGAQLSSQTLGNTPTLLTTAPPYRINNQINSNTALLWPSAASFLGKGASVSAVPPRSAPPLTATQKRAAALREQALQEASRWAKAIARRRHWSLKNARTDSKGQSVPDRTGEALQLLNL